MGGTERHGMKKKMIKMRSKKIQGEKYQFKFSVEYVRESKNKTKAVLKQLATLDKKEKKVSASKIVEDNLKKKPMLSSAKMKLLRRIMVAYCSLRKRLQN